MKMLFSSVALLATTVCPATTVPMRTTLAQEPLPVRCVDGVCRLDWQPVQPVVEVPPLFQSRVVSRGLKSTTWTPIFSPDVTVTQTQNMAQSEVVSVLVQEAEFDCSDSTRTRPLLFDGSTRMHRRQNRWQRRRAFERRMISRWR